MSKRIGHGRLNQGYPKNCIQLPIFRSESDFVRAITVDLHKELIEQDHLPRFHLHKDGVSFSSSALSDRDLQIAAQRNALLLTAEVGLAAGVEPGEHEKAERIFLGGRLVSQNVNGFLGGGTRQGRIRLEIVDRRPAEVALNIMNCGKTGLPGSVLNLKQNLLADRLVYELFSLSRHPWRLKQQHSGAGHSNRLRRKENELEDKSRLTLSTLRLKTCVGFSFRGRARAGGDVCCRPIEVGMDVLEGLRGFGEHPLGIFLRPRSVLSLFPEICSPANPS